MGKEIGTYGTYLWNDDWKFVETPLNTTYAEVMEQNLPWKKTGLPHDWLIYHTEDLYQDGMGWYRKEFEVADTEDRCIFIQFDGIYMDSCIYMNGHKIQEWKYGYSAFETEITPYVKIGRNEMVVSASFQGPNSRWYSGAGIYRNVRQKVVHAIGMIPEGGVYLSTCETAGGWRLFADTEVISYTNNKEERNLSNLFSIRHILRDCEERTIIWDAKADFSGEKKNVQIIELQNIKVWDIETPQLYEIETRLYNGDVLLQVEKCKIGFRTIEFFPDNGFFLNHRKVKLNGVCEHHDLGCLGAAYNQVAMKRKFEILQEMGVNAVRTSHNMPARELMDLADEMGILIMSEAFDMWEKSKTPYDYARFFHDWHEKDIKSWVRRDRNHPSVILWSIGNEIYDTHVDESGQKLTKMLLEETLAQDPRGNAKVTMGSNYMPWENAQKCADIVKLIGYNYAETYYEEHHKKHPDWILYGSETASVVQSRGIYHFPYKQQVLADEDEQCSALGNSATSWGAKNVEFCIKKERDTPFSCGQFLWTGFDYIGEPTPYHTRNSYFGQIDTAGFPKDSYYIFQAEWTDYRTKPMIHIFPYWDFNEGQEIDVRVCSNAPKVELFLNGISCGSRLIDHAEGDQLTADYILRYQKGVLKAVAYDLAGKVIAIEEKKSFGNSSEILLSSNKMRLKADGEDLAFIMVQMKDRDGNIVENAVDRVHITVEGTGYLAGVDNGDSTDQDGYKQYEKNLFSGKLLVVIAAGNKAGTIRVKVRAENLPEKEITLYAEETELVQGIGEGLYQCNEEEKKEEKTDEIPVRKISLVSSKGVELKQDCSETIVTATILPEDATDRMLYFEAVNDSGIPVNIAEIKQDGNKAQVKAIGDGKFHLRCMSKSSSPNIRLISQIDFNITGIGEAFQSAYEFISGGLYSTGRGQIGNGNEHGFSTARDGETLVGFEKIDFGEYGSDEITIPIFALTDDPYYIQIREGNPNEKEGELLADIVYQKPSIWNVYQEETYQLKKRLYGIKSIYFTTKNQKIHVKGFYFTKQEKAYSMICAADCDPIYGDAFRIEAKKVLNIGNNVTLEVHEMDFGEKGSDHVLIGGWTPLAKNTIQIRLEAKEGQIPDKRIEIADFEGGGQEEQTFWFSKIVGKWDISFVFLPGSNFDFYHFQFQPKDQ